MDQLPELSGSRGAMVAAARWLQVLGLLVAMVAAIRGLTRRVAGSPRAPERTEKDRGSAAQVIGLLVLSAIGAELLAAYDDSTGRVGPLLFAVLFFAALYGAPALLIREMARRAGWGWPSIVLLAFALGILQPGVIDQALFSADYRDIETGEASRQQTFIAPLGISAHMAINFPPFFC